MGTKARKLIVLISGFVLVAIFIFSQFQTRLTPKVISIQPANGAKEVDPKSQVEILFEKSVPEPIQGKFFIRLVPGVVTTNVWVSPKLLRVVPQGSFAPNTGYKVTVLFGDKEIYSSSFQTQYAKIYTDQEIQEIAKQALDTSAAFYKAVEVYPFITKLPIRKDNYTIVFDYDKQQFRIRLKMPSTAPEATKQEAINGALADMKAAGIKVDEYGYYVLYSE